MAAATYPTHPDNAYAGFDVQGDPYNTNNPGTYDSGFGAIASNEYEYPPDAYNNDYHVDQHQQQQQQQPYYSNDYQQVPYSNEDYTTQQPQHNPLNTYDQQQQAVLPNAYGQQPQNGHANSYPQQQTQNHPSNTYGQQSQNIPSNAYSQQHPNVPSNIHGQQPPNIYPNSHTHQPPVNNQQQQQHQQQPFYPNDYEQSPHSNSGYHTQPVPNVPLNTYAQPQPQPPINNQQTYYPNQFEQSPYDNNDSLSQQPPNPYAQQQQFNGYPNPQVPRIHQRPMLNNNNNDDFNNMNSMQPAYNQNMDNQHPESRNYQKTFVATTQRHPTSPVDHQYHPSENQTNNRPPKQEQQRHYPTSPSPADSNHQISKPRISVASIHRSSVSNNNENYQFEPIVKSNNTRQETKILKPNGSRDQMTKKKDNIRGDKSKDQNKPDAKKSKLSNVSSQTEGPSDLEKMKRNQKPTTSKNHRDNDSRSDDERHDRDKTNRNKKQSHSQSKSQKSRRDHYRSDDDYSSDDDDDEGCRRCRSRKTTTYSDTNLNRHSRLPPLRRLGKSSHYDSRQDQRLPSKHTSQRRFSQFDESLSFGLQSTRRDRHQMTRNASNHRDTRDLSHDRNRISKRKQVEQKRSTTRHDNERRDGHKSHRSQLGPLKSTRNDHTHRRHRGTCDKCGRSSPESDEHSSILDGRGRIRPNEIPFSHPPVRSDTYVETERIRAVRDAQGYYIPYKPYTLKDYNVLKKNFKVNPYSQRNESPVDRKELLKKGQEYGTFIEKQVIDSSDSRPAFSKENLPVRPWHGGISVLPDPEDAAKRERAIGYAKIQVRKYQETGTARSRSHKSDRDHYGHNTLPRMNGNESHLRICSICNGICTKPKQNLRHT
ncbi:hypothetical protein I4U23_029110 [Adineta vaga]|nr:hypothetical protein I4U23_029110 [Adineta vaga]